MSKVISASEAAALIKDGATLGASALGLSGWPEEVAIAIEKRFLASGHPTSMTFVHASGIGDWKSKGPQHFAPPGMVSRWIAAHAGLSRAALSAALFQPFFRACCRIGHFGLALL